MKKILLFIVAILSFFSFNHSFAEEDINLYFFWGDGCPHCAKEEKFLESLEEKYANLVINDFEVWNNKDNQLLLKDVAKTLNKNISGVPFTVVGNNSVSGYYNDRTTGKKIEELIKSCIENVCRDPIAGLLDSSLKANSTNGVLVDDDIWNQQNNSTGKIKDSGNNIDKNNKVNDSEKIIVPFLGEINIKQYSLPTLTIILGAVDGFNPCAMWILLFLISMLLGMENRAKMWTLGFAFILSSAFAYFLFITAWLNIILFFGFLFWIKIGLGVFAILAGAYNINEYIKNKNGGCSVVGEEKRTKMFDRIKKIVHEKSFLVALLGIVILAIAVNVVELLCSAGIPVVFTQVLSMNDLSSFEYYIYILLYIFFFMLDDLIVFTVSMITLRVTGITTKYTRYSHLIGGTLMFIIGFLLIFKPQVLMFG